MLHRCPKAVYQALGPFALTGRNVSHAKLLFSRCSLTLLYHSYERTGNEGEGKPAGNARQIRWLTAEGLERAMGFEPTTSCLGSKHSTTELRPLDLKGVLSNVSTAAPKSKPHISGSPGKSHIKLHSRHSGENRDDRSQPPKCDSPVRVINPRATGRPSCSRALPPSRPPTPRG